VPGHRKGSVREVTSAVVGLHAARTISAFPMAAARLDTADTLDSLRHYPNDSGLVRVRCMRKTLHILPLDLAAAAHCATVRYRRRDCRTLLERHLSNRRIASLSAELLTQLAEAWVNQAHLEAWFRSQPTVPVQAWRLLLKLLWEEGTVLCHNVAPAWNQEARQYRTSASHFGSDVLNVLDEADAERQLVGAYLQSYGPATVRDVAWWSGLSHGRVRQAIRSLPDARTVEAPWSSAELFVIDDEQASDLPEADWLRLVGHEDVVFKAYFQTRHRYVRPEHYDKLFNAIGEARPAIVVNGEAAGLWSWDRDHIVSTWFDEKVPAHLLDLLRAESSRLEALLLRRSPAVGSQQRLW
jgi:hypothetical protein